MNSGLNSLVLYPPGTDPWFWVMKPNHKAHFTPRFICFEFLHTLFMVTRKLIERDDSFGVLSRFAFCTIQSVFVLYNS